jgi:hypothetical protein
MQKVIDEIANKKRHDLPLVPGQRIRTDVDTTEAANDIQP